MSEEELKEQAMPEESAESKNADKSSTVAKEKVRIPHQEPCTQSDRCFKDTFEDAPDTTSSLSVDGPPLVKERSLTDRSSMSFNSGTEQQDSRPTSSYQNRPLSDAEVKASVESNPWKPAESPSLKSPPATVEPAEVEHLDSVDLEETSRPSRERRPSKVEDEQATHKSPPAKQSLPFQSAKAKFQGLSGSLPSVPWGPPPAAHAAPVQAVTRPAPTPAVTSTPARKLTSPFTWLSRNSSQKEPVVPPSVAPHRRDTTSTMASINSNPEMMLNKLDEGPENDVNQASSRNSLKDRFKLLRMREEAGVILGDDNQLNGTLSTLSASKAGSRQNTPPASPLLPSDPALAPGTAAGVSAGPSAMHDSASSVDWDLWQSVVYEGPAAVAKTSAEDLNKAIAAGIPSAIRGVVWQVLAQSKSEELEIMYKNLLTHGSDKDKDRNSNSSTDPSISNGSSNGRENVKSSASSVHSDHSSPGPAMTTGLHDASVALDKHAESAAKVSPMTIAEKKRKAKEDAAALSKLEKAIRRDLGARTSYSKYAASAGLQEGLFGVCKAYALYDEGVGYAQGMNFLAMPLLFNVCTSLTIVSSC